MTDRERFIEVMTFGKPDRLLVWQLFGFMPGVIERWESEGMLPVEDESEVYEFFGFDPRPTYIPVSYGPLPAAKKAIIEETEEYAVFTDELGRTNKLIKGSSTLPLPLSFPVKTPADWEAWEPRYKYREERFPDGWAQWRRDDGNGEQSIALQIMGMYHFPRQLMGDMELSLAFYDYPKMIRRMLDVYTDLVLALGETALARVDIDAVMLGEDFAYRGGSLISPTMFREFLAPYYRKVIGFFKQKGVKVFGVDSDGDVSEMIPPLLEVGVNCLFPFEVQAGSNIVEIRKQYGRSLAIVGGIDKLAIARGIDAIDRELDARLPEMRATGGYAASLDHRVTVETSFLDYLYYVDGVKRRLWE